MVDETGVVMTVGRVLFHPSPRALSLVALAFAAVPAGAAAEEHTCSESLVTWAEVDQFWAEWDLTGVTAPAVTVRAPRDHDASVTVSLRASFGPLEYAWDDGPHAVAAGESLAFDVEVPAGAFLHEMATDYVTRLVAVVTWTDERDHDGQEVGLPVAWLGWIDGDAHVWDDEDVSVEAPLGIVSATTRAEALEAGITSGTVHPPLWEEYPLEPAAIESRRDTEGGGE